MGKRKNPMRYFSGNAFDRLPLYKIVAGGMAGVLVASVGLGAMAASFVGSAAKVEAPQPTLTPVPTATVSPTPEPTPEPLTQLEMEVTVIQQDIGVQVKEVVSDPTEETDNADAETKGTEQAQEEFSEAEETLPLLNVGATILVTDENGDTQEYSIDTSTGTVLVEDVEPGEYTVAMQPMDDYEMPEEQTVTVKEKVIYKANIEAVKDKILQSSQVDESKEDQGDNSNVVPNELTDTVSYSESIAVEIPSDQTESPTPEPAQTPEPTVSYSVQVDENGYILMADGTSSAYKPTYDENGVLTGAVLEAPASTIAPQETENTISTENTENTENPEGNTESTEGNNAPAATPAAAEQTALPENISVTALSEYGFAVTAEEQQQETTVESAPEPTVQYEYSGWQTIDNNTYYYDPETHQPVTGSQVIQGVIYSFGEDGVMRNENRGIDVAKYQGSIDWNAVAADGISFAIIRVGFRGYGSGVLVEDDCFRANIEGATNAGLAVGVYFYSQAIDEDEAVEEASMVLSLCSGYSLPYGVYFDTEKVGGDTGRADSLSAEERTACAVAFCETIRNAGYAAGVYSYSSWFYNNLNFANISKYRIWIAQYRDTLNFSYGHNIWQYTSGGRVNGISKAVDMNIG